MIELRSSFENYFLSRASFVWPLSSCQLLGLDWQAGWLACLLTDRHSTFGLIACWLGWFENDQGGRSRNLLSLSFPTSLFKVKRRRRNDIMQINLERLLLRSLLFLATLHEYENRNWLAERGKVKGQNQEWTGKYSFTLAFHAMEVLCYKLLLFCCLMQIQICCELSP